MNEENWKDRNTGFWWKNEYEQRDRQNNVIITVLDENKTVNADVGDMIKDKLGCDIKPGDIEPTMNLKTNNTVKYPNTRVG